MKRLLAPGLLFLALRFLCGAEASATEIELDGAGARFPYPIYAKWFEAYGKIDPQVRFGYRPIGSDGGCREIAGRTVDFGASGGPLPASPDGLLYFPMAADAVAVVYNIPGLPKLKLDGAAVAAIFLGTLTRWDDPRIAKMNPGIELTATPIVAVHRSDAAASSYLFTDYLTQVSEEWRGRVGANTSVEWPIGIGAEGNQGILGQIKLIPGAIGYVELADLHSCALPYLEVRNAAGVFINPTPESIRAALATMPATDDRPQSAAKASSMVAYPISGTTGLLVYRSQADSGKAKKLVAFLSWAETEGQAAVRDSGYPQLPDAVRNRGLSRIAEIGD